MNNYFILLLITLYKPIKYNHTFVIKSIISYTIVTVAWICQLWYIQSMIRVKPEFQTVITSGKKVLRYELILHLYLVDTTFIQILGHDILGHDIY